MASRTTKLLLLFTLAHMSLSSGQIGLFINQLLGYSSLADCAMFQVSTIVRDMEDGCGDDSKTTSYDCFCHTSSSYFSSFIGSKMEKACATENPSFQKTSAVELFDSYCHLGDILTSVTSSASLLLSAASSAESSSMAISTSVSASPVSTPHMASASASLNPLPSSTVQHPEDIQSPKNTKNTAIAVGVTVPIGIVAAAFVSFFIFWSKRQKPPEAPGMTDHSINDDKYEFTQNAKGVPPIYELQRDTVPLRSLELDGKMIIHKMPSARE